MIPRRRIGRHDADHLIATSPLPDKHPPARDPLWIEQQAEGTTHLIKHSETIQPQHQEARLIRLHQLFKGWAGTRFPSLNLSLS
jgi:hypothetical protein